MYWLEERKLGLHVFKNKRQTSIKLQKSYKPYKIHYRLNFFKLLKITLHFIEI